MFRIFAPTKPKTKMKKYVSWRRVSTQKQNRSGLGLEAQRDIIAYFIERDGGELIADYSECYTGKDLAGCVELRKAMAHAKAEGAVLIIAKSDRFRNCQEALGILDAMGEGGVEFCDLPHTDRFTLTLFFALAEREALIVSIRTRQALAAKKARGFALGAASEKYKQARALKDENEIKTENMERGKTRTMRHLQSRDVVAFIKVMRRVLGEELCPGENPADWAWERMSFKAGVRRDILAMMADYKSLDDTGALFRNWDFSDFDSRVLYNKLTSYIQALRKSAANAAA